jgi:hypothetical protein
MSEPYPTIEMASKVTDLACPADCRLGIAQLELFRSQRLRQAGLTMRTLSELYAPRQAASCAAPNWPEGLNRVDDLRSPVRHYIALRQADARLQGMEPELKSAGANLKEALQLELCLVGSIAFWVVAGLLAGWGELEGPRKPPPAAHT